MTLPIFTSVTSAPWLRARLPAVALFGNRQVVEVEKILHSGRTVIWGNVGTNVFLTLLCDSVLAGLGAFFFSAVVITLFGGLAITVPNHLVATHNTPPVSHRSRS
jgi:hypothetical protein